VANTDIPWTAGNPNDRSVFGFRIRHGSRRGPMSKTKYLSLKKAGRGPRETELGGMILISRRAEEEWDRANERPTGALARLVKREAEARHRKARLGAAALKKKRKS